MTVKETFDNFILSRQLADLSPKTVSDYRQFVMPFLAAVNPDRDYETLSQADINAYIQVLLKKPVSRATKATYIRNMKVYLRWCENEYGASYQATRIKVPKSPKKSVRIYTDADVRKIFGSVHSETLWLTYRNKCIVALMYDSGLRQSEVCSLRWGKIAFAENRMSVYGKGNKERTVPLGQLTQHFMRLYKGACPYETDKVFVNRHGEPLTCNAVKLFMSRLANGLPFELSSHKLRHNFATNYCIDQYEKYGRVDIYQLMYLMGHEEIETTQRYLHFAMEIIAARGAISHLDNILKT